jgi:hypothetical protein
MGTGLERIPTVNKEAFNVDNKCTDCGGPLKVRRNPRRVTRV